MKLSGFAVLAFGLVAWVKEAGSSLAFLHFGFRRSHHAANTRARSCCLSLDEFFGITHRAPAERLTSNEKSVALTLPKSTPLPTPPLLCVNNRLKLRLGRASGQGRCASGASTGASRNRESFRANDAAPPPGRFFWVLGKLYASYRGLPSIQNGGPKKFNFTTATSYYRDRCLLA